VPMKATCAVSDTNPWAEDESYALVEHRTVKSKKCHQVLRWMLNEHPYLARQLSVFNSQAHREIPPRW
jgi:hypothetical protein